MNPRALNEFTINAIQYWYEREESALSFIKARKVWKTINPCTREDPSASRLIAVSVTRARDFGKPIYTTCADTTSESPLDRWALRRECTYTCTHIYIRSIYQTSVVRPKSSGNVAFRIVTGHYDPSGRGDLRIHCGTRERCIWIQWCVSL